MDSLDIDSMTNEQIRAALDDAKSKLEIAVRQISHLDSQIAYLRRLFRRAEKNKGYAVRYNLRMQLSIVSGVKVMYHHYVATKEDRINRLRQRIIAKRNSSSSIPVQGAANSAQASSSRANIPLTSARTAANIVRAISVSSQFAPQISVEAMEERMDP